MSKLYNSYENLKEINSDTIYLFECGNFYIALDSDAIIMNGIFNLKLTNFSNVCDKCGFPKNSLAKYEELLKNKNIDYKVISQNHKSSDDKLKEIRDLILNSDLEKFEKNHMQILFQKILNLIVE